MSRMKLKHLIWTCGLQGLKGNVERGLLLKGENKLKTQSTQYLVRENVDMRLISDRKAVGLSLGL